MKQLGILIILVIFILSVSLNMYGFVYPWVHQRGVREGMNLIQNEMFRQYRQTGRLQMAIDGKTVIFTPIETDPAHQTQGGRDEIKK